MAGVSDASLKLAFKRSADEMGDAPEMTVTLLRHTGTKRVLYMEAGKDFVDLLFSFLLLPALKLLAASFSSKNGLNGVFGPRVIVSE